MNAGPFPDRTAHSVGQKGHTETPVVFPQAFLYAFLIDQLVFLDGKRIVWSIAAITWRGSTQTGEWLGFAVCRATRRGAGGGGEGRWAAAALSLRFYRVPPPGRDLRGGAASGSLPFPIWMILDPMPGGACVAWACHAGESRLLFQEEPGGNRRFIPLLIFLPYLWPPHEASGCFAAETGQSHI